MLDDWKCVFVEQFSLLIKSRAEYSYETCLCSTLLTVDRF